jgi:hypothetical protein
MTMLFSQRPGRWERHLQRKRNNPLFPESERTVSANALQEAQRLDHEELVDFITDFQQLIHQAVNLNTNEGSEVILEMKGRLDKTYEQASGLADDQTETKEAIRKLQQVIMAAVRSGAGNDAQALAELADEERARAAHFELLKQPVVADLLAPDSPVSEKELVPTLLNETRDGLEAALVLFDDAQLGVLCNEAHQLLKSMEADKSETLQQARQRLIEMETRLTTDASGRAN